MSYRVQYCIPDGTLPSFLQLIYCVHPPFSLPPQIIVVTLLRSIPMLIDVLCLAGFYFTIFGVLTVGPSG